MTTYGTVVVDGYDYDIIALTLHDAEFHIRAVRKGPVRPVTDTPAAVFGRDGTGICQSWQTTITPLEATANWIEIDLPIKITHLVAP